MKRDDFTDFGLATCVCVAMPDPHDCTKQILATIDDSDGLTTKSITISIPARPDSDGFVLLTFTNGVGANTHVELSPNSLRALGDLLLTPTAVAPIPRTLEPSVN